MVFQNIINMLGMEYIRWWLGKKLPEGFTYYTIREVQRMDHVDRGFHLFDMFADRNPLWATHVENLSAPTMGQVVAAQNRYPMTYAVSWWLGMSLTYSQNKISALDATTRHYGPGFQENPDQIQARINSNFATRA